LTTYEVDEANAPSLEISEEIQLESSGVLQTGIHDFSFLELLESED
jgi:hypothetical protein